MGAGVRDDYLLANGERLHYRDWGDRSAPPVVLLHGFTGHARSWDSLALALSGCHRVFALDQRGHGESGWADDYSTEAMVSDVRAFVAALGLTSFDLLGLSMGGANAYHYAGSRPAELSRLVIVDIGPEIIPGGLQRVQSGAQANDTFDSPEAAIEQARSANARADEQELRHRIRNAIMRTADGRWTYRYDAALRTAGLPRPRPSNEQNWAAWNNINVPTLVIRGGESDILGADTAARMVAAIPHCRLVEIAGSGHTIPLDAPVRFREAVLSFL